MKKGERKWNLLENGRITGPFTATELRARHAAHEITAITLCKIAHTLLQILPWEPLYYHFPEFSSQPQREQVPPITVNKFLYCPQCQTAYQGEVEKCGGCGGVLTPSRSYSRFCIERLLFIPFMMVVVFALSFLVSSPDARMLPIVVPAIYVLAYQFGGMRFTEYFGEGKVPKYAYKSFSWLRFGKESIPFIGIILLFVMSAVSFGIRDYVHYTRTHKESDVAQQELLGNSVLQVGVFTFKVPAAWEVVSGREEREAKREIESGVQQMIDRYRSGSGSLQGFKGIEVFKAVRMPNGAGWFMAYTIRIPPQQDYMTTMEKEQEQKIAWAKQQGMITNVVEFGRRKIGQSELIKVDAEMRGGARNITLSYWSVAEPSLVAQVNVLVNPGYTSMYPDIDAALGSLLIERRTK